MNDHHVSESLADRTLAQLLRSHAVTQSDCGVGEDAEQLPSKHTALLTWTVRVRDQDFRLVLLVKVAAEFVQIQVLLHLFRLLLALLCDSGMICLTQRLDGVRRARFMSFAFPPPALALLLLLLLHLHLLEQGIPPLLVLDPAQGVRDNLVLVLILDTIARPVLLTVLKWRGDEFKRGRGKEKVNTILTFCRWCSLSNNIFLRSAFSSTSWVGASESLESLMSAVVGQKQNAIRVNT